MSNPFTKKLSRRELIFRAGAGFSGLALASLLDKDGLLAAEPGQQKRANPLTAKPGHFPAKAKSVIFLFMYGGPSQMDLFDYKPKLNELDGQLCPDSLMEKERFAFIKGHPKILGTPYRFDRVG